MPAGSAASPRSRFRLRHEHDFYCRGRHKNGENYLSISKTFPDGSCALMTKTPNLKFSAITPYWKTPYWCLQNMARSPSTWWSKCHCHPDNANEESESYYQISCQFKFRHLTTPANREDTAGPDLEAKRKRESDNLGQYMLYTNDNLIGHSIYHYLIDSHENATRLSYADVIHEKHLPLAQTIIFNLINKDISAIRIVDLLNALAFPAALQPVLMVKSDIVRLCRELINFDNAMIISEKSPTLFHHRPARQRRQRTAAARTVQTAFTTGVSRSSNCPLQQYIIISVFTPARHGS